MYSLKDIVHIDRRFQNSVNLQLDIENKEKADSYIPSKSSLAVLKRFLKNVLEDNAEKSVILIGPYGKGKSHLLLVLLYLLSLESAEDGKTLLNKIKQADEEAGMLICRVMNERSSMLPVLVSGTQEGLSHDFLTGLLEALKRRHLTDIMPDTFFEEALKRIQNWQVQYPQTYQAYEACLKKEGISKEVFESRLSHYQEDTLKLFKKWYPMLTSGSEFQPFVQNDVLKIYQEVNRKLCSQYGYGGIYIVFDEFSKYIEGHEKDSFANDMKILQDMCELSGASKEERLYLTLVAHKSVREYSTGLSAEIVQSFRGVEGRLKEIPFVVSAHNNYELIGNVMEKKSDADAYIQADIQYQDIVEQSFSFSCFQGEFTEEDYRKIIGRGCYPLLPLTAYALLHISEKVGQNERSVFTFLANEEPGSLLRFIEQHKSGQRAFVGADYLYDYFENLFRRNVSQSEIHKEWLKAEYALKHTDSDKEARVIKTMAVLLMLKNSGELLVNDKSLRLAAGYEKKEFDEIMESLKKKQLILWRMRIGMYQFKNYAGVDVEREIGEMTARLPKYLSVGKLLGEVSDLDYVLPRQYNQKYAITRYFRYDYMTQEEFLHLPDSAALFQESFADGRIIALIRNAKIKEEKIREHLKKLNDKRLVVVVPLEEFKGEELLRRYLAVTKMLEDEAFLENNQVLIQELEMYKEDLLFELNAYLERNYLPDYGTCRVIYEGEIEESKIKEMGFNRFLGKLCRNNYKHTPIINNELINRQQISVAIRKARGKLVQALLQGEDMGQFEKGTSAEATIYRALFLRTGLAGSGEADKGLLKVIAKIQEFIACAGQEKQCMKKLIDALTGTGYGVRKGVLPIYLAKVLADMPDMPVLYLKNMQTDITDITLSNACEKPEDYFLYVEKQNLEKEQYLKRLEKAFGKEKTYLKQNRMGEIFANMQDWCRSLPKYTRETKKCIPSIESDDWKNFVQIRKYLLQSGGNAGEFLFRKIPDMMKDVKFSILADKLTAWKQAADKHMDTVADEVVFTIKKVFLAAPEESCNNILEEFYKKQEPVLKTRIFSGKAGNFYQHIQNKMSYDDRETADAVAKDITGFHLSDWTDEIAQSFEEELRNVRELAVEETEEISTDGKCRLQFTTSEGQVIEKYYSTQEDGASYFMQNSLEEVWEEFGDTLTKEQKLSVMMKVLEKYI